MSLDTPKQPLILISNDDSIAAPGIAVLVRVMRRLGEVVVVAPAAPQSGMGHAITLSEPLRLDRSQLFEGIEAYTCSGTPADCVKIAKHLVLKGRRPDLVVSGVNHGSNASVNVIYSGTMSAALEAAIEGLPAIGFSLCDFSHQADFSHAEPWIEHVAREALSKGVPAGTALNVNIPKKSDDPIVGAKVCRQARAKWQEEFDTRQDPYRRPYYWVLGNFLNEEIHAEDTDEWALAHNYVSIVPCQFDFTHHAGLRELHGAWTLQLPGRPTPAEPEQPTPVSPGDYGPANPQG
ncbi:5'/3'-nucleotidase SurE [Hymenobacter jeollabukensis]|uniref:5'-nucleotidase SurE n=1 Tax=Hymenobacter jeollabukensis TaxID=2025313 RepID=A0A5R8WVS4_9BACT|nr:5'/3'-nucleotidase SurE [Hymenobacter jeollabukensis]TLM96579.1 5'/3'-nucleotidase SurE [Hymenobacter jeollabukensis]